MSEILAAYKEASGKEDLEPIHLRSDEQIRIGKEEVAQGSMLGMAKLAMAITVGEGMKSNYEAEGLLDNELLGLPRVDLSELVANHLREMEQQKS